MRIRVSYTNANAAQVGYNVLQQLTDGLLRAGVDFVISPVDPNGGNDLEFSIWRNEDALSQVLAVEHVHDDGSADHNEGDSVVGDSSVLPVAVQSNTRTLDSGRVYSAEELRPDPESVTVNDMIGETDAGSAGEAAREAAFEAKTDPEALSEGATVPSDEVTETGPASGQPASGT